ncbi:hypothetical protein HA466_0105560 [Hirschfeldia incana]|nr:hypothetical protein HA466_0105560 [Hirschfeldia incana]
MDLLMVDVNVLGRSGSSAPKILGKDMESRLKGLLSGEGTPEFREFQDRAYSVLKGGKRYSLLIFGWFFMRKSMTCVSLEVELRKGFPKKRFTVYRKLKKALLKDSTSFLTTWTSVASHNAWIPSYCRSDSLNISQQKF